MNNKGFLFGAVAVVPSIFITIALLNIGVSQLPSVTDNFREKKAIELCVTSGGCDCEKMVSIMDKKAILAYIKDDEVPTKTLNYGNM